MGETPEARARAELDAVIKADHASPGEGFERLVAVMKRLRGPNGCPWDAAQRFETIAPYTIEEAYEVADAIERGDLDGLCDELGDLLLQVVFHAAIAEDQGAFDVSAVCRSICEKMIRRHPHVFEGAEHWDWEGIKAAERAAKGAADGPVKALADVPVGLPALLRAQKLQKRAARVGFDWPNAAPTLDKLQEEAAELAAAIEDSDPAEIAEEYGDLLFTMVNLARHLKLDAESALRAANAKFVRRFEHMEAALHAEGRSPAEASLDEMEAGWRAAKRAEKDPA